MIKSPQDFAAGAFLIVVAAVAWLASASLSQGGGGGLGAGTLPQAAAVLLGGLGAIIAFGSAIWPGESLSRWSLREIAVVLGAVMVFALTIRGFAMPALGLTVPALGLAVAGPVTVTIAALADRTARLGETIVFAVVITSVCIGLFRYLLQLPIPVCPPLLGY